MRLAAGGAARRAEMKQQRITAPSADIPLRARADSRRATDSTSTSSDPARPDPDASSYRDLQRGGAALTHDSRTCLSPSAAAGGSVRQPPAAARSRTVTAAPALALSQSFFSRYTMSRTKHD